MNEYLHLAHMSEITNDDIANVYYLPDHHIINESSSTTKVEVVAEDYQGLNILIISKIQNLLK